MDVGQIPGSKPVEDSDRTCGRILSVSGSQASVGLPAASIDPARDASITVGKFLRIQRAKSLLIGMVTEVTQDITNAAHEQGFRAAARLDMMGEIKQRDDGQHYFQRGVTDYPAIGDPAALIIRDELRLIYDISGSDTIDIGHLQQDTTIGAYINVDEMLSKHFAVLGTTGVGKSSGVALILRQILDARPNLRLFLLDGHNEYARCFGDKALVLNPRNLKLPFWLFNFEETIDVFFAGRPGVEEEVMVLAELIPQAKSNYTQQYRSGDRPMLKRSDPKTTGYTGDTPVPYRLADLIALIDERMGKLENRSSRMVYHKLIQRIETVRIDPRYAFMFDNANVGGDTMGDTLRQLFRLPADGKPMTIMQLAGFPAEVVELGRVGALPHGVRFRHVERRRVPAAVRVRRSAPLCVGRQVDRLRPDPQGALAYRQGRPQVRRVPRARHAAAGRARLHHHLAVLHTVRHAHGERARPGHRALRGVGRGREPARLRALARHPRSARLRRRRRAADTAEVQATTREPDPAQPSRHQRDDGRSQRRERRLHRHDHRPLARRDDEQQADRRRRRRLRVDGAR